MFFQACELKAFLNCFPIISIFPKVSKIFRNLLLSKIQIVKFSVYFRFSLHVFRTFKSVKVHELGSWSSYSNTRISTNPYEERSKTDQNLILFVQHIITLDLIQFCLSRVFSIAWYFPLGYSHSSITSNQINIFYGFDRMALF